ncbi:MAG: hypothetical protein KKG99_09810 [Bacteroidetes bacterium]|nr:hypothetical protein [Bacteroidota bacterium]
MKKQDNINKLRTKLAYFKILYRIFCFHNFQLKLIDLILRVYDKKDAFLDTEISSNELIINSLHQDIRHLKKKLKVNG